MHSGHFEARPLSSEWRGMELLAAMCQHARLTNREAESLLLYTRGIGFTWQAALFGISRQAVWQTWVRGVEKMADAYAHLWQPPPGEATWEADLLQCFRNSRKYPDHAPQCVRDFWGRWWEGGRSPLLLPCDLAGESIERTFLVWLEAWLVEMQEQGRRVEVAVAEGRAAA